VTYSAGRPHPQRDTYGLAIHGMLGERAQAVSIRRDVKTIGVRPSAPQWLWDTYVVAAPLEMLMACLDLEDLPLPNRLAPLLAI
jgi:hypothetical protein